MKSKCSMMNCVMTLSRQGLFHSFLEHFLWTFYYLTFIFSNLLTFYFSHHAQDGTRTRKSIAQDDYSSSGMASRSPRTSSSSTRSSSKARPSSSARMSSADKMAPPSLVGERHSTSISRRGDSGTPKDSLLVPELHGPQGSRGESGGLTPRDV